MRDSAFIDPCPCCGMYPIEPRETALEWDIDIAALELSVRTRFMLRNAGVRTVGQLMRTDVHSIQGAGARTTQEINEVVDALRANARRPGE